ncbi:MAG: EAL domain-containing protein [Acetobacteraceae bacterium]
MSASSALDPFPVSVCKGSSGWRPRSGLTRWLLLAFGSIAALTVFAATLSEHSSRALNHSIAIVADQSLPVTRTGVRLAEETASLAAAAPLLADAPTLAAAEDARGRLDLDLAAVQDLTAQLSGRSSGAGEIAPIVASLGGAYNRVESHVIERLASDANLRHTIAMAIRLHRAIIDQVTPLVDDAEFALFLDLRVNAPTLDPTIDRAMAGQRAQRLIRYAKLAKVATGANLSLGLLTEAALTSDPALLEPLSERFRSLMADFGDALAGTGADPAITRLGASIAQLEPLAFGPSGVFELRRRELAAAATSELALGDAQALTRMLNQPVELLVGSAENVARGEVMNARETVAAEHVFQLGIAVGVVALAGALAFFLASRFRRAEARELRELAEAAFEAIVICRDGVICGANSRLAEILGSDPPYGRPLASIVEVDNGAALPGALDGAESGPVAAVLRAPHGTIPVEIRARITAAGSTARQVVAIRDLRERAAAEARIRYLAYHDPLTGLGNREHFKERLDHALAFARRSGQRVALLCLDLDGFKAVNDLYGHAAGDAVLRETARRLRATVRETDSICRLGGDEFVVVQTGIATADAAVRLSERIVETLSEVYPMTFDCQADVTASVGVALFPDDTEEAETLLAHADAALYRVKHDGRSSFSFFRPEMDADLRSRRQIEHDLRHAAALGQLVLEFQPEADCATGRVVGFEALLRWRHPTRGLIPPAEFIPLAEASGTILSIGAFVLREACLAAAAWPRPLNVAVNVSPVQLHQGDLPQRVLEALSASGLPPARLELEVTESVLIRDAGRARRVLEEIRALGVRIALDDFGAGYSSLGTLRFFPFDRVKIDRSFVRNLPARDAITIMRAVLTLGRGLDITVLAEGVETPDQLASLRDMGCDEVQGYLLGRPQPIETWHALTGPTSVPLAAV